MNDRLPASLAYILIYNPSLPPPSHTSRDDEDAQEEAHILFYTSRERAVSRDRMLRQVGLAKALVNFSEIFALGQGCENVHSQTKRMIHVSPEPNFWMHACIDLARTRKLNKDDARMLKGKDPTPQAYYYHDDSLHDLALRSHLLRGYEAFKLLHGTFTSVLESRGSEGLRAQLEVFFTPWAWKWDLERPVEFSAHLGLPLHPLNSTLISIVTSFFKSVPPHASPLLVCPPYIIDPTKSLPQYPPSLPVYLLSLVPSPGLPILRRPSSKRQNPSKSVWSVTASTNNTLGFLSAAGAGMGDAVNVKKWSWPEALTFSKHKSTQHKVDGVRPAESEDVPKESTKITISSPSPNTSDTCVEGDVDQCALDDAISNQNPGSSRDDLVRPIDRNAKGSQVGASADNVHLSSAAEDQGPDVPPNILTHLMPPLPSPLPSGHSFSEFKAFVSEPLDSLVVQRRSVLYLSMFQLVFAILMDAGWLGIESDESLRALQHNTPGFLQEVRRAIDLSNTGSSSATTETKVAPNRTRHVISLSHSVSTREGTPTTSSQFFESQEILTRYPDTIEVFSRTTTPQQWFVGRRGLGLNKAGDKVEGEAYLEAGNKEASLVDVDNELVGTVRRWVHGGE